MDYNQLVLILPPLLKQHIPSLQLAYLFGSQASGSAVASSDVDIAILSSSKLAPLNRWGIESELADKLSSEVDLVDLLSASTVMQYQIIQTGICIYDPEKKAAGFEMQVMSMYQHLNDERADILKQSVGI